MVVTSAEGDEVIVEVLAPGSTWLGAEIGGSVLLPAISSEANSVAFAEGAGEIVGDEGLMVPFAISLGPNAVPFDKVVVPLRAGTAVALTDVSAPSEPTGGDVVVSWSLKLVVVGDEGLVAFDEPESSVVLPEGSGVGASKWSVSTPACFKSIVIEVDDALVGSGMDAGGEVGVGEVGGSDQIPLVSFPPFKVDTGVGVHMGGEDKRVDCVQTSLLVVVVTEDDHADASDVPVSLPALDAASDGVASGTGDEADISSELSV
jgi:hypothetical protein